MSQPEIRLCDDGCFGSPLAVGHNFWSLDLETSAVEKKMAGISRNQVFVKNGKQTACQHMFNILCRVMKHETSWQVFVQHLSHQVLLYLALVKTWAASWYHSISFHGIQWAIKLAPIDGILGMEKNISVALINPFCCSTLLAKEDFRGTKRVNRLMAIAT